MADTPLTRFYVLTLASESADALHEAILGAAAGGIAPSVVSLPEFDLYASGERLADGARIVAHQSHLSDETYEFTLNLHNAGDRTVDLGGFRFALLTAAYAGVAEDRDRTVALPDGRRAIYWDFAGRVYPGDWRPLRFELGAAGLHDRPDGAPGDAFRISSDFGVREIAVTLVRHSAVLSLLDEARHEARTDY